MNASPLRSTRQGKFTPVRFLLLRALSLLLTVSLVPIAASVAADTGALAPCKIAQVDTTQILRAGWPKFPGLLSTSGSPKFLVVGVDFSDAPMTEYRASEIEQVLELNRVTDRYRYVSAGRFNPRFEIFPDWVRLPEVSSHYGTDRERVEFVEGEWGTHHLVHDLVQIMNKKRNLNNYQGILAFVSGGQALSGRASYATLLDKDLSKESGGIENHIVIGRGWELENRVDKWRPVVHEINHLLGLPDLYIYDPEGYWQGRTPGPFGQQAFVFDAASDSLGWNRWLNGWIPDSQVLCISDSRNIDKVYMSPPNDGDESGNQLTIYQISPSKALVIEALNAQGYDAETYENSLLVYQVDSSVKSGDGPVTIIPRPTALTTAPLSPTLPDWVRFTEAPLIPNSYVEYGNLLIVNEMKQKAGALLSVYSGEARLKKLNELLGVSSNETTQASEAKKVVLKTIICKKGKLTKKVRAEKPKCPKGYKKVKGS